jgi:hypothetical protein
MKRVLCILISVFLLISAAACKSNVSEEKSDETKAGLPDPAAELSVSEPPSYPAPDLPSKNYGGIAFNVICNDASAQNGSYPYSELGASEDTGEILNDSIYRRNRMLEEKYGIEIVCAEISIADDILDRIKNSVLADDKAYDMASGTINKSFTLASQGYLMPLNDFASVDLNAPWWLPHLTKSTSIGGVNYLTPGYSNIAFFDSIGTIYFNKTVLANLNLTSPYAMVENNEWTIDNFIAMCKNVTKDFDGDGEYTEKDMYGFMTNNSSWSQFFYSTGNRILSKDKDDIPAMDFINQKSLGLLEKIISFVNDTNAAYLAEKYTGWPPSGDGWTLRRDFPYAGLLENRALFVADLIYSIRYFRNMQADFGIVPPPKYDALQEEYISYVHPTSPTVTIVPATNDKRELTGAFLEDLMYMSYEYVRPVYFETALNTKFVRDDESVRMLERIFNGACIDIGLSVTTIDNDVRTSMAKNIFDIQSTYEKNESANLKSLDDLIKAFTEIK